MLGKLKYLEGSACFDTGLNKDLTAFSFGRLILVSADPAWWKRLSWCGSGWGQPEALLSVYWGLSCLSPVKTTKVKKSTGCRKALKPDASCPSHQKHESFLPQISIQSFQSMTQDVGVLGGGWIAYSCSFQSS